MGRLICLLHQRRLSHRDLKAANLLVRREPSGALTLWFIDLVGVVRHRRLGRSRRVQNLARLHTSFRNHPAITRTDKLRFLRTYLRWGLRGKHGWKAWWRLIEAATPAPRSPAIYAIGGLWARSASQVGVPPTSLAKRGQWAYGGRPDARTWSTVSDRLVMRFA